MFVLDCSVALAWCLPDEDNGYADRVLELLTEQQAVVPALWHLEVMNVLLVAVRKGRIEAETVSAILQALRQLNIVTYARAPQIDYGDLMEFAYEHEVTLYDATYLHLALRENLTLATLDKQMATVARKLERYLNP